MKVKRGVPATALLAGGLSRHGRLCSCRYCREEYDVPVLAGYNRISHAAHYGTGGHDLDRWVIRSIERPASEKLTALGVAPDAKYHSGYVHNGQQHWIYTAIRPLSVGVACLTCDAVSSPERTRRSRVPQTMTMTPCSVGFPPTTTRAPTRPRPTS